VLGRSPVRCPDGAVGTNAPRREAVVVSWLYARVPVVPHVRSEKGGTVCPVCPISVFDPESSVIDRIAFERPGRSRLRRRESELLPGGHSLATKAAGGWLVGCCLAIYLVAQPPLLLLWLVRATGKEETLALPFGRSRVRDNLPATTTTTTTTGRRCVHHGGDPSSLHDPSSWFRHFVRARR
jgi:hypothetical protein